MSTGDADALGKSLDGRDDRVLPTSGALTVDYGVHSAFLMRRPDVFITVDCRENFGDAKPWASLIAAAPDLLATLITEHACATLRADGTCDGCRVSEVIAKATA